MRPSRPATFIGVAVALGTVACRFVAPDLDTAKATLPWLVALCVVGGSVGCGAYVAKASRSTANRQATQLATAFAGIARRTGLRVDQGAPSDQPSGAPVIASPSLIGLYRGHWVRVRLNVLGDRIDQLEILMSPAEVVRWPALGRLRGARTAGLSPSSRDAIARIEARPGHAGFFDALKVSPTALRCVIRDTLTDAASAAQVVRTELEATLDDLVVVADGLPTVGAARVAPPDQAAPDGPAAQPHARHVLVLDEAGAFGALLRSAIEARGAVVIVARGDEGVRLAGASRPDLILLFDDGDGWIAVCNRLRRSPGLRGVPMVVVSSAPSDALFEQHRGLATAADDYVQGPVAVEALLERADRLARLGAD